MTVCNLNRECVQIILTCVFILPISVDICPSIRSLMSLKNIVKHNDNTVIYNTIYVSLI